ncbi:hypothetical protein [Nocardia xishanensis]|uniref:Uncharacterized protein n=1 Tax=Nocardia xishanensis TaxID=238964 RepID=A0ABW7X1S0_9NOCA
MLPTADEVWAAADLVLKVKEPVAEEYSRMRPAAALSGRAPASADVGARR